MENNLENGLREVHEKFHVVQEILDSDAYDSVSTSMLMDFAGTICEYCATNESFEKWYSETGIASHHFFNELLARERVSGITEKELRETYEHTRENIEKSLEKRFNA